MARPSAAPRRPLRRFLPAVAGVVTVATVATLAVVLDGYDAQEVPALSSSVWVTRDSGQYARVNTELAEIDTVRAAEDPDVVLQNGDAGLVFTGGYGRVWPIDAANPGDLGSAGDQAEGALATSEATPNGTRAAVQAGGWVLYFTTAGRSYLGRLPDGSDIPVPILLDPFRDVVVAEGEEPPSFVATAATVDENGLVAMYSPTEGAVRIYDARRDEFRDPVEVPSGPDEESRPQLALIRGSWVLFDAADDRLWVQGRAEPIATELGAAAKLQASSTSSDRIHIADASGLFAFDLSTGQAEELTSGGGTPAQPTVVAGSLVAAWVSESSGRLWSEDTGEVVELAVEGDILEDVDEIIPVIRSNGSRAVLNETASGMLWRLPDGQPIPVAQWTLEDENDRDEGTIQVDDIAEQKPPVAVADAFGVRAGELVLLPLLLNDHDPNKKDVLTIVPESITSIGDFGSISLASNDQHAVVRVAAGGGSASFSYAVTDGVSVSPPATVTLTVVGDDVNTAPEWCGVTECVQEWPSPGIAAGGTVTVPVLSGWVDPEGDVIVLADAAKDDPTAPVTVVATADGDVVVRHQDPNAGDAVIPITVTVADARGASATRTLEVRVTTNPSLVAEPIAVVAGVNEKISVDVTKHVRGGSGSFSIVDAVQTSSAGELVVVPNAASGRIDLAASATGNYVVTYTVQDLKTQAQQSSLLRVTVTDARVLSIAPITAFVRLNEDTTVDVLAAVQNTSGRVLLVSEATSSDPELGVSVVGQAHVRVSGTTAGGLPGRVGTATVTVTDGAGNAVQGTITVFLVAPSTVSGPIAVPDTVTVRAGNQADILALANDVSPRGERIVLHPELQASGADGELAFVAGDRVRYLAPSTPGVYVLTYSIYLENSPGLLDTATITVTVMPPGSNRDPQPPILTARVVAGQSVAIPFSGSGVDPDGDRVVLADVTQPTSGQGIAEISAEGDAIVYTAPGNGVAGGQVSFPYRVRDAEGATAEGIVRVGVLATDVSDVSPVTYGDYVRVQAGTVAPLTVTPLLNDRDPLQGRLELQSVVPNAPAGSPEYARLEALLDIDGLAAGEVSVQSGDVLGVHSYVYTVISQKSFSNAQGLIVVNVTDGPSPDAPIVTDTVVTAQNRGLLSSGLDVVTGKVQWASGDPTGLELSIWGPAASRYSVEGGRISGPLPDGGDIVPFSLTGSSPTGSTVVSYGFLLIPAFDDMRIQLRPGAEPISVPEEQSASFTVRDMLDLGSTDAIEIRDDDRFAVQRGNASCTPTSGASVTYAAGREAPWTDTCTVPVRIVGQKTWTLLGVPVLIEPKDPQAILNSISRTISPGDKTQVVIDLYKDMTSWEGGRTGDLTLLDYQIAFSGSVFIVTPGPDDTVLIDVRANAKPGTRESVRVSVGAYGGLTAGISLVVGIAPPDAPRGANFTQRCEVTAATCAIQVVGKPGEYDPFAGEPDAGLTVVGVGGTASGGVVTCPVANVKVGSDRQLVATWPAGPKPAGGECVVPYTVADAQGRTGQGQVTIDVYGYPQRPTTVSTVAYSPTSVTVDVTLGEARNAHPAMDDIVLYRVGGGKVADDCFSTGPNTYRCVITGLENGERDSYTARAVNSIGESLDSSALETWAYREPEITSPVTATAVYRPGTTTDQNAVVELSITASTDAQTFQVSEGGNPVGTITRTATTTTGDVTRAPGSHTLTVTPISQFSPPPINGTVASNAGDPRVVTVTFIGSPTVAGVSAVTGAAGTSLQFSVASVNQNNAPSLTTIYYAWTSGAPTCTDNGAGDQNPITGAFTSTSSTVTGLDPNVEYSIGVCVSNGFGTAPAATGTAYTFLAPTPIPTGLTYSVPTAYDESGGHLSPTVYSYGPISEPPLPDADQDGFTAYFQVGSSRADNLDSLIGAGSSPSVTALYCAQIGTATVCDTDHQVAIGWTGAPSPVSVSFPWCWSGSSGDAPTWSIMTGSGAPFALHDDPEDLGDDEFRFKISGWSAPFGDLEVPPAVDIPRCQP